MPETTPSDGGGDLQQKVARLYWITDDHGTRLGRLESMELVRFVTEMRLGFDGLKNDMNRLSRIVTTANLPALTETVNTMKGQLDDVITTEAEDRGKDKKSGEFIARVVMPCIALAAVIVAVLALVIGSSG